jgi:hypothetical protein
VDFYVSSTGTSLTSTGSTLTYGGSLLARASFGAIGSCSSASTTKIITSTVSITNNKFSYSGTDLTVTGTFSSATQASGTYKLTTSFTNCGVSSVTASGNWTATWKSTVVPDAGPEVPRADVRPDVLGPDTADARPDSGADTMDAPQDLPAMDLDTAADVESPPLDTTVDLGIDGV